MVGPEAVVRIQLCGRGMAYAHCCMNLPPGLSICTIESLLSSKPL